MEQTAGKSSFRTDSRQTRDDFLSQFLEASEEIVVKVEWTWSRGSSGFPAFGKEVLAHMHFCQPWEADEAHPLGKRGTVYYFSPRKLIGYPYSPRFIKSRCCRLRVRRCRDAENIFLLEDVLERNTDIAADREICRKVLDRFRARFLPGTEDVLVYCAHDLDVRRMKRPDGMAIGYAYLDYSALLRETEEAPRMVGRCLAVPFNDREFAENRKLKLKAGSVCRIRVYRDKKDPEALVLDRLLEAGIRNEALTRAGEEALRPVKWPVEGFGDFDIVWDRISMKACREDVRWDPADEKSSVSVYLACDPDNCHTASKTTLDFLRVCKDRKAFEEEIFLAAAESLSDEEGMVETWDDETGTIPKEELIPRLTLEFLSFEAEGIDIMIGLDELFTDHAFSLYKKADGRIIINGLWG